MIKVLAIDDEPLALRQLEIYISKVPFLELVASCSSANDAKAHIDKADAIFIDINMPDLSGMDFVKSLENPPLVVFTTAYSEYAVEGFRVDAAGYLLKPFSFDEFSRTAERLQKRLEERKAAQAAAQATDHIFFKTDYKNVRVDFNDIVWIESMSEYIKIHFEDQAPLIILYSLKKLEEQLPSDRFCRVHRSYIVSLSHIREAGNNSLTLTDGRSVPVSDSYRQRLKEALSQSLA